MATTVSNALYLNVEPIEYWHLDDHLLSTNWILALLIGIGGFQFLKTTANYRSIYFYFALTFILAIAPLTYLHHFKTNDQKNSFLYYGYGISTLQIMPKGTLFFAESDYDYFSLLYLKTILNKRPDTHLVLMPFLSKTGEAEALKRCDPDISRDLGKLLFKNLIIRNQSLRPIMTMFPNGSFSKEYLRNFDRLSIDPMGLAVVVSPSRTNPNNSINYSSLINFWGHYADPSLRTTYAEEGLLRHACSLAYSNEAYCEGLNTQFKNKNEKINRSNRIKTYTIMAKRLN